MLNNRIFNTAHSYETNLAMREIMQDMIDKSSKVFKDKFTKALDEQFGKVCFNKLQTLKNERKVFGEITTEDHYKHLVELLHCKIDFLEYTLLYNVGAPSYLEISHRLKTVKRFKNIWTLSALEPWEVEDLAHKVSNNGELEIYAIAEVETCLAQIVVNEILSYLLDVTINQSYMLNNTISRLALLVVNHTRFAEYTNLLNRLLIFNSRCSLTTSDNHLKVCTSYRCNEDTYLTPVGLIDLNDFYLNITKGQLELEI